MRTGLVALAAIGMVGAWGGSAVAAPTAEGVVVGADRANRIAGSYLVTLKSGGARALAGKYGGTVTHVYTSALKGFAAKLSDRDARRLAADPAVAKVEADGVVRASAVASWGLDRIDQRDLPLDNSYTAPNTASNVTAYIIDTGIRTTHQDFAGRARWGTNTTGDGNNTDCNGHGTHVAGTVAGAAHGVAKAAKLVAVKVLNCQGSGSFAGVAAGIDWVTANAVKPAVANMSLGGPGSNATVETAVKNSIAAGITYAVAAGNSNSDACNFTPARVPEAVTVGSLDRTDTRSSFSNFGTCLDIFAPGREITSAYNTSDTATSTLSGTSMASPHVAGAAALLASANPGWTPQQIRDSMVNSATNGKIPDPGAGSPNKLLFVGAGGPPPTGKAIRGAGSNRCLDISGGNATDGAALVIWDCSSAASQQWTFGTDGTLRSLGKCADVYGAGTANGTAVIIWTCHGGANQRWSYDSASKSYRSAQSGKCLDVYGAGTANGSKLIIWPCHGGTNQQWTLPA